MDRGALYELIEDRRKELGLSQAEVSARAFGRADSAAIQNIRRGSSPAIDRVAALCDTLGLEFYIGRPREKTQAPDVDTMRISGEDYRLIARYAVSVSAGPGLVPIDEAEDGKLAFAVDWLARQGIDPGVSGLVKVKGQSMAPTLPDGALVLVHGRENAPVRHGLYAYSRGGEAFVKRLLPVEPDRDGRPRSIVVLSDNPEYPPEIVTGRALNDLRIVGRVRCVLTTI